MPIFLTTFEAIDQSDKKLKTYKGPYISASSFEEAEILCLQLYTHCVVVGELIEKYHLLTGKKSPFKIDFVINLN